MNLIPETARENGNYLCTWSLQERVAEQLGIDGRSGTECQRNALNAALLFDYQPVHWIPNWIGKTFSLTIRPPRMNAPLRSLACAGR